MSTLLTPRQAAERLGISYSTLKRWVLAGRIRTLKTPKGHHRIPADELSAYLPRTVSVTTSRFSEPNRLQATVVEVNIVGLMAEVALTVGSNRVTAIVTADAVRDLDIRPGDGAFVFLPALEMTLRSGARR